MYKVTFKSVELIYDGYFTRRCSFRKLSLIVFSQYYFSGGLLIYYSCIICAHMILLDLHIGRNILCIGVSTTPSKTPPLFFSVKSPLKPANCSSLPFLGSSPHSILQHMKGKSGITKMRTLML